jgi:tRNA1Val (adenine37-N6)-methyltransferase
VSETDLTEDRFLAGRLRLLQPAHGYRAGMDAVLLGAAAGAIRVESALEAGCGPGAALLSAALRAAHGLLAGIESDSAAADLCRRNAALNGLEGKVDVFAEDILAPSPGLLGRFDLVFSNPPFFDDESAIRDPAPARRAAYIIGAPLAAWIKAMGKLAAPKGRLVIIHRADRLPDILSALGGLAGDVAVYPVRPRAGEPAKRVLVSARKGSRAPLRLLKGLDVHPESGGGRFTPDYEALAAGQAAIAL